MNNDNSWVANLKLGDAVMLGNIYRSGDLFIATVTRITEKRVYVRRGEIETYHREYEFNRENGQVIPKIYKIEISQLTSEQLEEFEREEVEKMEQARIASKRKSLIYGIRSVALESLGTDRLERINDFIAMIEMEEYV